MNLNFFIYVLMSIHALVTSSLGKRAPLTTIPFPLKIDPLKYTFHERYFYIFVELMSIRPVTSYEILF